MKIDVKFPTGKVYDLQERLDVVVGTPITLYFSEITEGQKIKLFSDNDAVLDIESDDISAKIMVSSEGQSVLFLMDGKNVIREIDINATKEIAEPVATLNITGTVIPK